MRAPTWQPASVRNHPESVCKIAGHWPDTEHAPFGLGLRTRQSGWVV
jgi:hypothetical protein